MGDISAEPSMEEILSSIKRIIAEEGEGPQGRQRRPSRAPAASLAPPPAEDEPDEILELSDPIARDAAPKVAPPAADPVPTAPILSQQTAAASRGALDSLSRLVTKPEPSGDGTLEGLVREMLRPMLREWLDANLPGMVETMVAREIAKITAQH